MGILSVALVLAGAAHAAAPGPAVKAHLHELRESVRDGKRRIKQAALDQHKGFQLIREREKADLTLTKSSAASPETMHLALLAVREKYRHESKALRERRRNELAWLRDTIKRCRAELAVLTAKK